MLSTNIQVNTVSYLLADQASAGNRSFIPVRPSQFIYSQFEYVSGVPSNEGGVSVSQLQILNSLIDHMIQKNSLAQTKKQDAEKLNSADLEKELVTMQKQMQKQDALSKEIPYIKKALETGSAFSFQV